ncbi:MAG: hypothetical protein QOG35_2583 [Solirubrobacteraceae bacterium]|jgi:protein-disulfide isomerase|nr:hypothetical protein [Solirubrobacteraceae bacterium]
MKPTKAEAKAAVRHVREQAEATAAARRRRSSRLRGLAGVVGVAVVLVVVGIVVSGAGGGDKAGSRPAAIAKTAGPIPGQRESAAMLAGIPQRGITLGRADAPVHLIEFADLQCPFCREYALQTMPILIQDYVRTGKVSMEFRNLSFLGPDSVAAGRAASAAAAQNRLWNFTDLFYYNQGKENSGYVSPAFLSRLTTAAGVDATRAKTDAAASSAQAPLAAANTLASRYGVQSTPTILVGPRGGTMKPVAADPTDTSAFKAAIDQALAGR